MDGRTYAGDLAAEKFGYAGCEHVHELPSIFHYWSEKHVRPRLQVFGYEGPEDFFEKELLAIGARRVVSLGSGNCELEIALASKLRGDFLIDCVDLNETMLARGRAAAEAAGVSANVRFVAADLNEWRAAGRYDAVIANQSLHHLVNLEGVLDEVKRALRPGGALLASDMIGRNGHRRWPEALAIVYEFWRKLPPSYRFNRQTGFYEEWYQDRDYSSEGFEGVRAQEILRLLLERFHVRFFFGFANAIDAFVDRGIGPNFNAAAEWDRGFIDAVQARDEAEIAEGRLTPTHMLAAMSVEAGEFRGNLRPEACLRPPDSEPHEAAAPELAYEVSAWPHAAEQELAVVRSRLAELTAIVREHAQRLEDLRREVNWGAGLQQELKDRTAWAMQMERQFEERSAWAKRLEADVAERTAWAQRLEEQLAERTAWALELDGLYAESQKELAESAAWGEDLSRQLGPRAAWAKQLEAEAQAQTARADALQAEISGYLRNPLRLLGRAAAGIRRRLAGR